MNIFMPIRRNARAFPRRTALVLDGKELTYEELLQATAVAASRLQQGGVGKGDSVALSVSRPGLYVLLALAIARIGAIVTSFDIKWPAEQSSTVLKRHKVRALVRDFGEDWRHPSLPEDRYFAAAELLQPVPAGSEFRIPPVAMDVGDQPWYIALSSGTTGAPKSIPQSHERAVLCSAMVAGQGVPEDLERVLVFSSPHLSMSMNTILQQLVPGRTVVIAGGRTPEQFFAAVERDRPTRVATSTGNAIRLVAYAAQSMPDSLAKCRSLRSISIAGSAASPALRAQLAKYICPRVEIVYGSSEASRVAELTPETLAVRPESAGLLCPWVEMEAVDEQGQPLPAGVSGVLRVRSPLVAAGYLGDAQANARAFRDGWYYPGDTGHVDGAGYLTLTGRVDELLNLGGNKVDPFMIEAVLDAQPGIEESVVVAAGNERGAPVMIALVVTSAPVDEEALRKACLDQLGSQYVPLQIRRTESIPRNAGGKVIRREIAERVAKLAPDASSGEKA